MSPRPDDGPQPLRGLLSGAAGRFGLDDAMSTGALWKRWSEIVGADVAAHAAPTSLRGGVLRVRADSPVWAHEIGYLVEEIRTRANEALGAPAVTEVRVYNAPADGSDPPASDPGEAAATEAANRAAPPLPEAPEEALKRAREAWLRRVEEEDDRRV
ncbi:MAG TPA: DUF721 domain-containing protein [Actinomycetota bacterium]|nr:DUF721 domain-containing protein [Actinomycetota bacterium]